MLALCPGRCLLHHKRHWKLSDNFFSRHSVKREVSSSQWSNSHPFNFLYETRLYHGNAILQILYRRLKENYWRQQNIGRWKSIWFRGELSFCPKIIVGRQECTAKKIGVGTPFRGIAKWERCSVPTPNIKEDWCLQEFPHWTFLFHFSGTVLYTR